MPTGTLSPVARQQFFDLTGLLPLSGGLLYTLQSGTSTPATTWLASTLTPGNENTNPIVLDAAGRCVIYLDPTSYKYVLQDQFGGPIWTQDPITAINAGSAGLGETFVFGGNSSSPVTAASYPAGATFDKLQPGTAVFIEDAANLTGSFVIQGTGMVVGANTLTVALVDLSDGAPDTPIASLTFTSLTGQVATSAVITWPAPGSDKSYGIEAQITGGSGYAWGIALVRLA